MVFEVLMDRQMERHIFCNKLLTVFQSGFHQHHSTAVQNYAQNYSVEASMLVGPFMSVNEHNLKVLVVKKLLLGL
jgi:hypothetical protein